MHDGMPGPTCARLSRHSARSALTCRPAAVATGLPSGASPEKTEEFIGQGFGRKSAEATGLMEGDRAFQGIFPAKKMVEKLEPILPAAQPGHPSKEKGQK